MANELKCDKQSCLHIASHSAHTGHGFGCDYNACDVIKAQHQCVVLSLYHLPFSVARTLVVRAFKTLNTVINDRGRYACTRDMYVDMCKHKAVKHASMCLHMSTVCLLRCGQSSFNDCELTQG